METLRSFRRAARPLIAALVLCSALVFAAPRAGAQYGGNQGFLIDPSIVEQGELVNLLGAACGPNTEIIFVIRELGLILTRTITGPDGDGAFFAANVLIPEADVPPGLYTIEARCSGQSSSVASSATARLDPLPGYVPNPRNPVATLLVLARSTNQCIAATNASIRAAGQQNVTTTSIYCPTTGAGVGPAGSLAFTGNRAPDVWVRGGIALVLGGAFVILFKRRRSFAGGQRDRTDRRSMG